MASSPLLLYSHPETGELLRRRWRLLVMDGHDRGVVAEIDSSPALIGAAPAATLVLSDDTVSRYHAEIDVFADGLRIRDLDSTNGTFVGEHRVRDAFIENGGEFRAGRTTLQAVADDEAAASEIDTDPRGVPLGAVEVVGGVRAVAASSREILRLVRKIAFSSSAVLFEGPPGSGKATFAKLLHNLSPRRERPFVTFSPASMQRAADIEHQLFGGIPVRHGPMFARLGLLEIAKGGTLFIDGIDHLPEVLQPALLRTIESGEIQRPGGDRKHRIDVRLVSSAVSPLARNIRFNAALFRRLAVVHLRVPSLRERPDDIPALAQHFLEQDLGRDVHIGERARGLMSSLPWEGNLDQLRALMSAVASLPDPSRGVEAPSARAEASLAQALRCAFVEDTVSKRRGHVTAAAGDLGMSTRELFRFLSAHQIDLDRM